MASAAFFRALARNRSKDKVKVVEETDDHASWRDRFRRGK
jgi:hypothetical protein